MEIQEIDTRWTRTTEAATIELLRQALEWVPISKYTKASRLRERIQRRLDAWDERSGA